MASDSEELLERNLRSVSERLGRQALVHDEALALLAKSRLWSARDDLVDLLAARRDQLSASAPPATKEPT